MMSEKIARMTVHGLCLGGGALALVIGLTINWALPDPQAPVYGGSLYSLAGALLLAARLPLQGLVDWHRRRRSAPRRRAKQAEG